MHRQACPLALRSLRWLGLLPTEMASLGVRAAPLTDRDVALARRLLDKEDLRDAPAILHEVGNASSSQSSVHLVQFAASISFMVSRSLNLSPF